MGSIIEISNLAYAKLIMHAAKYPHSSVNGLLIGKGSSTLSVTDAVPLFHQNLNLAPMLEAALLHVDNYCRKEGLHIVGYYQANHSFNDSSPDVVAYRIGEKIAEYFSDAVLIMVDNKTLSFELTNSAINVTQYNDGKWKAKDKKSVVLLPGQSQMLQGTTHLLLERVHSCLVDFDNHLDDISQDWLNRKLNGIISECI
uniref:EOG090X0C9C n=1 Tax=Lynceus sp. MCZ IZ 141354 TaxID=1930659 RepID=A0A9N6ZEQ9_9CRUS|nr:EOG090X0C9C [Lynceus sp. MCZ IZ 141354]